MNIKGVFQIWMKDGSYHEIDLKECHGWTRQGLQELPRLRRRARRHLHRRHRRGQRLDAHDRAHRTRRGGHRADDRRRLDHRPPGPDRRDGDAAAAPAVDRQPAPLARVRRHAPPPSASRRRRRRPPRPAADPPPTDTAARPTPTAVDARTDQRLRVSNRRLRQILRTGPRNRDANVDCVPDLLHAGFEFGLELVELRVRRGLRGHVAAVGVLADLLELVLAVAPRPCRACRRALRRSRPGC